MNLNNYIEKLRMKSQRERERIAVIATGVAFAVIFVIWLVSFNEMNRSAQSETENQPNQLEDLKNNFGSGKASIEEMFQDLPSAGNNLEQNNNAINEEQTAPEGNNAKNVPNDNIDKDGTEIPQLP